MGQQQVLAGASLFGLVFAAGFLFGALREVLVRPYLGASLARLLELPLMIAFTWWASGYVIRKAGPLPVRQWLDVGVLAFALLIAAEFLLGWLALGITPRAFLADLFTLTGLLSFLAQSLLVVIPAWIAAKSH